VALSENEVFGLVFADSADYKTILANN
jgi:hypothetical protein